MELNRNPTMLEERLLELFVKKSSKDIPEDWSDGLQVRSTEDGEMGSLHLFPKEKVVEGRIFGDMTSDF